MQEAVTAQGGKTFQRKAQVDAALVGRYGVNLVDNH
jgi:hypothetical protein